MSTFYTVPPQPNDIMHYGVRGMKWGIRKSKYYRDDGSLTRYGKLRASKHKMSPDQYKAQKKKLKSDIDKKYADIQSNTRLGQKLIYSNGTRRRQAEYMVNRGMNKYDAARKAKIDAWKTGGIAAAAALAANVGSRVAYKKLVERKAKKEGKRVIWI